MQWYVLLAFSYGVRNGSIIAPLRTPLPKWGVYNSTYPGALPKPVLFYQYNIRMEFTISDHCEPLDSLTSYWCQNDPLITYTWECLMPKLATDLSKPE